MVLLSSRLPLARLPHFDSDEAHPSPDEGVRYGGAEVYLGSVGLQPGPYSRVIGYRLEDHVHGAGRQDPDGGIVPLADHVRQGHHKDPHHGYAQGHPQDLEGEVSVDVGSGGYSGGLQAEGE